MNSGTFAIASTAFCMGLFVAVVPVIAPDVATGLEDSGLVAPNNVTINRFAALWEPTSATSKRRVDRRRHAGNRGRKVVRAEGWPYCDPACLRGSGQTDQAHVALTAGGSAVKSTPTNTASINRTRKGDRLAPAAAKQMPLGCESTFSAVAEPTHSHIYKRCVT